MKRQIFETLETVHTHTHTDILLIENRFASITELSNVICHVKKSTQNN